MRIVKVLFLCHCGASVLGLIGLLIMLPHPQIWDTTPSVVAVFNFNMAYTGSLYIRLGAATLLLFGLCAVGVKKTLIFFGASTLISLSLELLGTSTGFPFGPYVYADLLGFKILGHVPYAIPLSWFYMGFTSYLLASILAARFGWRHQTLWSLMLGAYFLTVWDLSLDPAMASPHLSVQFWTWFETGPYFGMPIRNLVGWSITGLLFMSMSRLCWGENLDTRRVAAWLPFGVYTANTCFAIALTFGAGIWPPSLVAVVLGLLPATLVLRGKGDSGSVRREMTRRISYLVMRLGGAMLARQKVSSEIIGIEHLPQQGPVFIVARHFHHLYDGCLLLQATPRRLHILVALDWIQRPLLRRLMEGLCRAVAWPVVLRGERLNATHAGERRSAYDRSEVNSYVRRASTLAIQLLRQGEILVVFPEAYPVIDPLASPREDATALLPFRSGFARLLELAEKDGQTHVAVVPAGFHYARRERWQATLRFGPALFRQDFATTGQLTQAVEQRVRELSSPQTDPAPAQAQMS